MLRNQLIALAGANADADRVRGVVTAYLGSLASQDIEARAALFAPDAIFEDPVGSKPVVGLEALRSVWTASRGLKVTASLKRLIVCGREACYEFVADLDAGDGDRASINCIETLKLDAKGRIVEMRAYFDRSCIGGFIP